MDEDGRSFEDTLRAMAREFSESVERAIEQIDVDGIARMTGIDPGRAREWAQGAGEWLREQAEGFDPSAFDPRAHRPHNPEPPRPPRGDPRGDEPARPAPPRGGATEPAGLAPHPLDMPTEEQGVALAALDSGRWTVEPGTQMLTGRGQGPGPSDALGLVRELRVRDWISDDGRVTRVGQRALERWLGASASGL